MQKSFKKLTLCSNSPRRRELLSGLDLEFTVDTKTSFEEVVPPGMAPEDIPMHMALGKAGGFHRPLEEGELLITADTIVICNGKALGKPAPNKESAAAMLRMLSGKTHMVITAVCITSLEEQISFTDRSEVTFCALTDDEIDYYTDKYQPYDKAGAYGVQEWIGYVGIERIEGSFYNVMGLPVHKLWRALSTT
ncbi:MAG: septum formation protein Maf [Bacteroidales bacterium]|nr:septum formation protein Maf [Bacteroidales bacterium]